MTNSLQLDKLIETTGNFKKTVSKKTGIASGILVEICIRKKKKILFRDSKSFTYSLDGYHDAVKWKREITESIKIGKPINLIKAEGITLDLAIELADSDVKEGWHQCAEEYRAACFKSLGRFSDFVGNKRNLRTLGDDDMEAFSHELLKIRKTNKKGESKQLTFRTMNQMLIQIGKVFNLAFRRGYIDKPIRVPKFNEKKQPPIDKRPFSYIEDDNGNVVTNEEQDFYNACNRRGGVFNEYAMILQLGVNTGMREEELINARINWIDWDRKLLQIPAIVTKAKKARDVHLNPIAFSIAKYFKHGRKGNVKLLVSHYPAVLKREQVSVHGDAGMFKWYSTKLRHYFVKIKDDLGIDDNRLTFHSTRHTAISRLINSPSRPSIFDVKEWIGHEDVETTMGYWQQETRAKSQMSNELLLHPAAHRTISNEKLLKTYLGKDNVIEIPFHDGAGHWTLNKKWEDKKLEVMQRKRRAGTMGRPKTFSRY